MSKTFNVVIERDEKEAIELCLEVEGDLVTNEFIGVQQVSV